MSSSERRVSFRCVQVLVPRKVSRTCLRSPLTGRPARRLALRAAAGHSTQGSTRGAAEQLTITPSEVSTVAETVYSCTMVSAPSSLTCESR